ncbi:putative rRNA maturation protein (Nop14) [Aspergillus bombycis]|uniref:Putative rRNA maturation protein (Nop14) n=1 Tax=Aspergillus bombycis TaxID=109264 RepID=A0A1F7ZPE5_9EURO|nr:putative rRNA maturation protein (Nop14) [Aspergillus bombycis]OGM40988.1 putative rRNA maturation protein (Nop14) [Aspergillus bombycis]
MPPSQLKQLKASLRDSGVLGPQQSKKQKRQNVKSGAAAQNRVQRNAALQSIRDRFNPFEIKAGGTRTKFDVTTRDGNSGTAASRARPGVTKSLGEEKRRQTLLREMEKRNKVGGILDRRFGEDDPTMTPEERAAERYARASQRKMRKESMFNLEGDDEEEEFQLTHKGQSLNDIDQDDFQEGDLGGLEDDASDSEAARKRKRVVFDDGEIDGPEDLEDGEEHPERKKSKHEVMKEVIAKSKFHKYERQKAKEDDDDLREELDKGLPDLFEMLRGVKPPPKPEPPKSDLASMNPDRAALLEGIAKGDTEKEYDQRLKQLTFDKRSKPTDRTKTEEEKATEEAERLKALEEERVRRMRGEEVSESEEEEEDEEEEEGSEISEDESIPDDAKAFGLQQSSGQTSNRPELADEEILSGEESEEDVEEDEEDELINGFTLPSDSAGEAPATADAPAGNEVLAYTYPCPKNHEEFLEIIKDVPMEDLPVVVQRIRALYHHRLHPDNKKKLSQFSRILIQHVAYMAEQPEHPPFAILENILRHVHSLAKSHPESVSQEFRARLREIAADRPLNLRPSDLVILTGIATTFPTSDHFHAVATPAHLCLSRYLGQGAVNTLADFATGAYAASLVLQYQSVSKRYMPELINYILNALCNLAPEEPKSSFGLFPSRSPEESLRLKISKSLKSRKLQFWDVTGPESPKTQEELKLSLISTFISLLSTASDMWSDISAFLEIFDPAQKVFSFLNRSCKGKIPSTVQDTLQLTVDKLDGHTSKARLTRRPLLLHDHRPLAIKTAIPKFEDTFNPDKHYDPNRERAEANRLKAEYKRERKGAMRELRKDANFIAREKLREKKERDAEYEKKYKRLVAEVQNQEGREANAYERERRLRQGKR